MTFKYNNVYIGNSSTVVGPYESKFPFKNKFDKIYKDLYCESKTWEQAEINMNIDSVNILLKKLKLQKNDIDIQIGGDLLNQLAATNYSSSKIGIPLIGIYSACSTSVLGIIIASNMVDTSQIKNAIITTSSHNNAAEKQFRNPVEYGGPKKKYSTFTTTGSASLYISNEESNIKIESSTIGTVIDMGIKDANNMGAVMAPAAAKVIYDHLKDTNRSVDYYDLVLTGDLGVVGKYILKEYIKSEYNIELNNYEDSACLIYDLEKQNVYSGGSGPACLPLVAYTYIFDKIKKGKLNKVLLVATGALVNTNLTNQKLSIPAIAHLVSLEVVK